VKVLSLSVELEETAKGRRKRIPTTKSKVLAS
jgi:hypothetical protein